MTPDQFRAIPLRPYAGRRSSANAITLYAHGNYHSPTFTDWLLETAEPMPPGFYLLYGSEDNPAFSWPIYANIVQRRPI